MIDETRNTESSYAAKPHLSKLKYTYVHIGKWMIGHWVNGETYIYIYIYTFTFTNRLRDVSLDYTTNYSMLPTLAPSV